MNTYIKCALPSGAFVRAAILAAVASPLLGGCGDDTTPQPQAPMPPKCESYAPGPLPRLEFPAQRLPVRVLEYDQEAFQPADGFPRINLGNHIAYTLSGALVYVDDTGAVACADGAAHSVARYAVTADEQTGVRTTRFSHEKVTETEQGVSITHGLEFGPFDQFEVTHNGNLVHIGGYEYNVDGHSDSVDITIQQRPDGHGGQSSYIWAHGAGYQNIIVTPTPDGARILPNHESQPAS